MLADAWVSDGYDIFSKRTIFILVIGIIQSGIYSEHGEGDCSLCYPGSTHYVTLVIEIIIGQHIFPKTQF